jgi:hypothetical protein
VVCVLLVACVHVIYPCAIPHSNCGSIYQFSCSSPCVPQCLIAMDSNFGFEVVRTIVITNVEQDIVANISAKFFKVIDGDDFALLDFYKSQSIHNLFACRAEGHYDRADVVKVIKQVCYEIRDLRDESFRSTVVGSKDRCPDLVTKDTSDKRFMPRSKQLRAVILAHSDTRMFKLTEVVGVVGECTCKSIVPVGRTNRNNQLWVVSVIAESSIIYRESLPTG